MAPKTPKTKAPVVPRHLRPIVTDPVVIVCHEKHGTVYFSANNDEDLFRVALMILRGRKKSGYWYSEPDKKPADPGFQAADIEKLPKTLQADARKKLVQYNTELGFWMDENETWVSIEKALAENDGRLAWQVLRDRCSAEYERISLEPLSTTYG